MFAAKNSIKRRFALSPAPATSAGTLVSNDTTRSDVGRIGRRGISLMARSLPDLQINAHFRYRALSNT